MLFIADKLSTMQVVSEHKTAVTSLNVYVNTRDNK